MSNQLLLGSALASGASALLGGLQGAAQAEVQAEAARLDQAVQEGERGRALLDAMAARRAAAGALGVDMAGSPQAGLDRDRRDVTRAIGISRAGHQAQLDALRLRRSSALQQALFSGAGGIVGAGIQTTARTADARRLGVLI